MLNAILSFFVNLIYLTPIKVRQFKKRNPGIEVFVAGATKARKMKDNTDPSYELGWATARRSTLILAIDGLYCGDWHIPLADIRNATAIRITGGLVLKISANDGLQYQFGLQYDPSWEEQTILPLEIERTELEYSSASLFLRLVVILLLVWFVLRDLTRQEIDIFTVIYLLFVVWFILPLARLLILKITRGGK